MAPCRLSGSVTSVRIAMAWPPAVSTACATSSPAAALISATQIFAPSRANSSAAARPIPVPAPVMNATLPSSRAMCVSFPGTLHPLPLGEGRGEGLPYGGSMKPVTPLSSGGEPRRGVRDDGLLVVAALAQHVLHDRQHLAQPQRMDEVVVARAVGVGMHENGETLAVEHEPRHQRGKHRDVEGDLIHRPHMRPDRLVAPAAHLHEEVVRHLLADLCRDLAGGG